jgi:C1A family cysteine protease
MNRLYTWKRDAFDARDRMFAHAGASIPRHVDLSPYCSPVEDQGQLGSCTGNAIAGGLEFLERHARGAYTDRSRLFIYWNERSVEKTVNQDAGAIIRDGVKSVAKLGACDEKLWPYNVRKFKRQPPAAAYHDASARRLTAYERCTSVEQVRQALAACMPVVFGFVVYPEFESDLVARTGVVPMPDFHNKNLGGHAVLAVGYDDPSQRLIVRNSWGASWGMKGYFTLPYAYLFGKLSDDFWVLKP